LIFLESIDELKMISILQRTLDFSLLSLPIALTFSRALVEVLLVLVILSWVLLQIILRKNPFKKNPIILPFFFFWISGVISVVVSKYWVRSLEELLNHSEYIFLTLIALDRFRQSRNLNVFTQITLLSAFVVSLDGLFQFFFGFDFIRMQQTSQIQGAIRLTASFSHPNSLAAYLAMVIPFVLGAFYQNRRWIYIILLPLLIFTIIFTYSRGAWIGLAVSLFVFASLQDRKLILALMALGLLSWFFLPDSLLDRIKDIYNLENATTKMRFELWKEAWNLFLQKPIFGHGLKTFSLLLEKGYAHNCYLQMLVELGLFGFLSFVSILIVFFRYVLGKNSRGLSLGLGCAIVASVVHSFSDTNLYSIPIATFFWLILGVGLAICLLQKDSNLT
jgi:O-antigen ligase